MFAAVEQMLEAIRALPAEALVELEKTLQRDCFRLPRRLGVVDSLLRYEESTQAFPAASMNFSRASMKTRRGSARNWFRSSMRAR